MKTLPLSVTVLAAATVLVSPVSAQLKADALAGRWQLVAVAPQLEAQATEYADFVGYSPSRAKDLIDEIRDMQKEKKPNLLVMTESDMSFEGAEIFGASARLEYKIEGSNLKTTFSGVASSTGGAGAKVKELVPESFAVSLRGDSLTLKSGPITGFKGKSITYKFQRFTKVEGEMREWQSGGGKTFQAKVVDFKNGTVYLENEDGKSIKVPATRLAAEDKEYLQQLIKDSK